MALTKDQKTAQVKELTTKLKDAQSVMFGHFTGLSVGDVSDLRNQLRENGAQMKVMKKTLIKLAFKEAGLPDIEPKEIDGAVACIMSFEDPLSGAQTAFKFSKDHDKVTLVGGVYDGKLLTAEESMELAKMPGREQLLGMFVGMLKSPLVNFAGICSSPLSGFSRALDQMADKGGFVKDANESEEPKPEEASAESEDTETPDPEKESDS
jgi:large subunit ribosomal protein L10